MLSYCNSFCALLITMSLYDDFDVKTRSTDNVSGWSSGIKLLQSQLQLKRATVTQPKRDTVRKASLAPVIDLKSKSREEEDNYPGAPLPPTKVSGQAHVRNFSTETLAEAFSGEAGIVNPDYTSGRLFRGRV